MQSRGVASHQTSIGTVNRKKGAASAARRRRRGGGHQDARSLLIAGVLMLVVAAIMAAIWLHARPFPVAPHALGSRPPPSAADLEIKKTHSYWKVGSNTYRHYITNAGTGEVIDAGTMTVREMLEQGIDVPGYSLPSKGGVAGSDELAIRFKALQDHLK